MRFLTSLLFVLAGCIFLGVSTPKTITVVIDAGHGGRDPGHLSHSTSHQTEKE